MARTLVAICVLVLLPSAGAYAAGGTPPPSAVTFQIQLDGSPLGLVRSCGSIGSETEVLEFTSGGSGVVTKIPGKTKVMNIVCTRNLSTDKTLSDWRHDIEVGTITRKNGQILLLDSAFNAVATFNFSNSWPNSLFIEGLDASTSAPITETVSIVVDNLSRQ